MAEAILVDLTSREPRRVIHAMWAVVRARDPAQLDALAAALSEIEAATDGLELGGMFYSNNATLAFALRKLRFHRDRAGCLCELYPELLLFDPDVEAEAGNVKLVTRDERSGASLCECTVCAARYDVEYGEQHSSWWRWRPVRRA